MGPAEDAPSLSALGDAGRLVQLLLVLLDNAFRHSPAGGRVTVGVAPGPGGGSVLATVDDEGPGVPDAERERIFEPFARLPGVAPAGGRGGAGSASRSHGAWPSSTAGR